MDRRLSKLMDDGNYYLPVDGHFVSQEQVRTAEILRDYNPDLELQWIPERDRTSADVQFRVVHRPPGRPPYVVLTASQADARLLARVFAADQQTAHGGRGKDLLNWLDQYNAAIELMEAKKAEEKRQEAHEIAYAAISSQKIHYRAPNAAGQIIDYGKPFGGRFG